MASGVRRRPVDLLGPLLVAVAIAALVVHFVLDSGDDDAPAWLLVAAIACAVGAVVSGGVIRRRRS